MKTAIQHLKISSARFHNFAFYLLTFYFPLHLSRVLYKSTLFMRNKPNLPNAQMNVSSVLTKYYENKRLADAANTKPIQTQYKPNLSLPKGDQTQPVVSLPALSFVEVSNLFQRQKMLLCQALLTGPANRNHPKSEGLPGWLSQIFLTGYRDSGTANIEFPKYSSSRCGRLME